MATKIVILDWSVTGLHPILKFRRSLDNLILNASGIFEASPVSYPVMIEDPIIAGRYAYDMSALTLNDGEYSYPVFDPASGVNIGTGECYVFQNSFVEIDIPLETINTTIQTTIGGNMYPFIAVQNLSISDGQPVDFISGDTKTLTFYLPTGWDVTLKHTFLCVKKNKADADALAIIDSECTVINGTTVSFTPTISQTSVEGLYYGELAQYDDSLGTVNPNTIMEFTINFSQRVRDLP
jgi:hypothetical protein